MLAGEEACFSHCGRPVGDFISVRDSFGEVVRGSFIRVVVVVFVIPGD